MVFSNVPEPTDLLLINASNLPYEPFYPYAFIMISARAKRVGIRVKRLELSNLVGKDIDLWLEKTISHCKPRMIGFTIRQTDTYTIQDYMDDTFAHYYPVDTLKEIIGKVRNLTSAPLALGGYGFSLHAQKILSYLDVPLGIKGCVDPLFDHFEEIITGQNLDKIPNLIYFRNDQFHENRQVYFEPFSEREYDDELLNEVVNHYGKIISYGRNYITLYNNGSPITLGNDGHPRQMHGILSQLPSIPIEVSRGCCFNCYFCSEPLIKGKKVVYRNPDVIEDEVRFCVTKNLREFWFVCSELNQGQSDFALVLAERMLKINESLGSNPLSWKAYHLPHYLARSDLEILYRSGFQTSWNDVVALNDGQLKKARVPYRTAHAVSFYKNDYSIRKEQNILPAIKFSIFLGDIYLTPQYLTKSLQTFHEEGLSEVCGGAAGVYGIRIFDWQKNQIGQENAVRFTPGDQKPDLIHPTFQVAPGLLKTFGHIDRVMEFFDYIVQTLLSNEYVNTLDWSYCLARFTTPEIMTGFIKNRPVQEGQDPLGVIFNASDSRVMKRLTQIYKKPAVESLQSVFYPSNREKTTSQKIARLLILSVRKCYLTRTNSLFSFLDLPELNPNQEMDVSPYYILSCLYRSYDTETELFQSVRQHLKLEQKDPEIFILKSILFQYNLVLKKSYKEWIFCE